MVSWPLLALPPISAGSGPGPPSGRLRGLLFFESAPMSQGQDQLGVGGGAAGHWEGSKNLMAQRKAWGGESEWKALGLWSEDLEQGIDLLMSLNIGYWWDAFF